MSLVDLAVVVVSYETRDRTLRCVESVLEQVGPDIECVVVDNASTDGTVEALRAIHDFRMTIVASDENLGFGAACNRGASVHSRARHVLFLNADTVLRPGAAQGIVDALEAADPPGAVGADIVDERGGVQRSVRGDPTPKALLFQHTALRFVRFGGSDYVAYKRPPVKDHDVPVVMGAALAVRGDVLRAVEGFDTRYFLYFEEADLCRRIRRAGHRVAVARGAVIEHAGGASSDPRRGQALIWYLASLFLYVDRFHGRGFGLFYRLVFKPFFLVRMVTDAIRDGLTWWLRPEKREDKAAELRLGAWFLRHGLWPFLVA